MNRSKVAFGCVMMWAIMGVGFASCSTREDAPAPPEERKGKQIEPYASLGIERVIPLRFVMMSRDASDPSECSGSYAPCSPMTCSDGTPNCDSTYYPSLTSINQSLDLANDQFKSTCIQFIVGSNEIYRMPHFAFVNYKPAANLYWTDIQSEMIPVFTGQGMTSSSFSPTAQTTDHYWKEIVTYLYAAPRSIFVWVSGYTGNYANAPEVGRDVFFNYGAFGQQESLGHELGHYFGMNHPVLLTNNLNPETNAYTTLADFWDLIYKPGTDAAHPHTFFSSREDAQAAAGATLYPLDRCGESTCGAGSNPGLPAACANDSHGKLTCCIGLLGCGGSAGSGGYHETYTDGDAPLKGMAFTTTNADAPTANPRSYKYGDNSMTYDETGLSTPNSFSDSQARLIRSSLRYELPATTGTVPTPGLDWNPVYVAGFNSYAPGSQNPNLVGLRPVLGQLVNEDMSRLIDFDGDQIRDIGTWTPPQRTTSCTGMPLPAGCLGHFHILLSTKSFADGAGNTIDVDLGNTGDTPVIADYDGDGLDDIGLYTPGPLTSGLPTDASTWTWCVTASSPVTTTCASPHTQSLGQRGDTPLPGLRMSSSSTGDSLVTYRPSNGTFYYATPGGSTSSIVFSGTAEPTSVPLPGLYDGDQYADLVLYNPRTATFSLRFSGSSWGTQKTITYPSEFIPQTSGTALQRSGGVPVRGMNNSRLVTAGGFTFNAPRLALAVWQPVSGDWTVTWSPDLASPTTGTCTFGRATDLPLGGLGVKAWLPATGQQSELAYFEAGHHAADSSANDDSYGLGYLHTVHSPVSSSDNCSTYLGSTIDEGPTPTRWRVFSVYDMTGDGYPEVIQADPDASQLHVLTSDSGYMNVMAAPSFLGITHSILL